MRSLATTFACALLAAPLASQEAPDTAKRVTELERRLAILSQELEAQKTGSSLSAAPVEGQKGLSPAAAKVYESKGGLSIGGYGEFLYQSFQNRLQDGTTGVGGRTVDALRLVLYTGYKFTDRIVFNSELEWEHGGYSDESPEGEAIVEFAYLDFLFTKALNLRAGMMLVPMGFINEIHEPPAFLGARRPLLEGEGGLIPTTWNENGIGLHGELPGNLTYRLYLMNGLNGAGFSGRGIAGGRQMGKQANAQSLAWTGRLDWSPVPGALAGGSFYTGNSNQTGTGEAFRTTIFDLHGEYRAAGLQLRGLFVRATNSPGYLATLDPSEASRDTGTRQWGGYLEAGYDLFRGGRQALIPFLRWERLNTQGQVIPSAVRDLATDQTVLTVGLNYKPIPNVAVKADFQRLENRARTGRNQTNLGLGFYF
jgi:hypothetical protein